jgi:arabinose-5-phosphate isomerase
LLGRSDVVLALSKSGETPEILQILNVAKRLRLPTIALCGAPGSTLARHADVNLDVSVSAEACPLGLAPTTSTTMMLALGDAIAVALLERNGFTAEHFQVLHPGGKLGRHLLRVSDLMDTGEDIPLASPGTIMSEVILIMTAKRHGCCGIADADGRLVGIITDGDLRRHMDGQLLARSAAEVMTKNPQTIRPEAFAAEALGLMNARKITTLFAVRDGRPVGFLYMHALLRAGVA